MSSEQEINKLRVLIVDDSAPIRTAAGGMLRQLGWQVEVAEDGFAALARLASFEFDIIFIDVVMPRLDGYETLSLLRVNPAFATIPVIMMSSKGGAFDIAKAKLIGCDDYIIKPFDKEEIVRITTKYAPHVTLTGDLAPEEA